MRHSQVTGSITTRIVKGQTVWVVRLDYGPDPLTGTRRQRRDDQTFSSERAARARLAALVHEANSAPAVDPRRRTIAELLVEWLAQEAALSVHPGTFEDYESICRVHLVPAFGAVQVARLSSAQVERWRAQKLAAGASTTLVARCTLHLSQALKYGVRHGYLAHNPLRALKALRHPHREMQVWTAEQARAFLDTATGHAYHPLWALAVYTGMRKGELIGVQWSDVDLEGATLRVRRSLSWANHQLRIEDTKNRQARTIDLNRDLITILRSHRIHQRERLLPLGKAALAQEWVCASAVGTPLNAYNISRAYHPLQEKAGVPRIRFHDLRHTCASLLLAAGTPVHVVSRQLGHSSAAITMRIYAHLMPGQGADAAETLRRLLEKHA